VTIKAIDSQEQQTEWKSAEPQSRWIRMWDEVGVTPEVGEKSAWAQKLGPIGSIQWDVDSEFGVGTRDAVQDDAGTKEERENKSMAVPNIDAMPDKQFEKYLQKLREMRPAFRQYLVKREEKRRRDQRLDPVEEYQRPSLWEGHLKAADHHKEFLAAQAYNDYNSKEARMVEQQPQRYGGLTYTQSSPLQNLLLVKPQKGRLLQKENTEAHRQHPEGDYVASFAGMTASVDKRRRGGVDPMDWSKLASSSGSVGRNTSEGVVSLRLQKAKIDTVPTTAGHNASGLQSAFITTKVVADAGTSDHGRSNVYVPGSREYIGHSEDVATFAGSMLNPPKRRNAQWKVTRGSLSNELMGTLSHMLNTAPRY